MTGLTHIINNYLHIFISSPWHYHGLIVKFCVHFKSHCLHVIDGHLSLNIHLISWYSPTKPIPPSLPSGPVRKKSTFPICSYKSCHVPTTPTHSKQLTRNLSQHSHCHNNQLTSYQNILSPSHESISYTWKAVSNKNTCAKNHHNKWPNRNWPAVKGN